MSATLDGESGGVYATQKEVNKVLVVVVTSNRGLCGGFNSSVTKKTIETIESQYNGKEVAIYAIGKKGNDLLSKSYSVIANKSAIFDDLTFNNVADIAQELMDLFAEGTYDEIAVVYNKFKNAATQITEVEQFLPIVPAEKDANVSLDYIFEPAESRNRTRINS